MFPVSSFPVTLTVESPSDSRRVVVDSIDVVLDEKSVIDAEAYADDVGVLRPLLKVGDVAQPVHAEQWTTPPPSGPMLVAFWATWCGPCVQTIPKLNELHEAGMSVVGLTEQNAQTVARSRWGKAMRYPSGSSSASLETFGVAGNGLPHYFLLDAAGRVAWHGQMVDAADLRARYDALVKPGK